MIHDFQPGDGTRYNLVTVDDPHGGLLVICNSSSLWRYHRGDQLKFLCGNNNEYTKKAIWNYFEMMEQGLPEDDDGISEEDYQMSLDDFQQTPYGMG